MAAAPQRPAPAPQPRPGPPIGATGQAVACRGGTPLWHSTAPAVAPARRRGLPRRGQRPGAVRHLGGRAPVGPCWRDIAYRQGHVARAAQARAAHQQGRGLPCQCSIGPQRGIAPIRRAQSGLGQASRVGLWQLSLPAEAVLPAMPAASPPGVFPRGAAGRACPQVPPPVRVRRAGGAPLQPRRPRSPWMRAPGAQVVQQGASRSAPSPQAQATGLRARCPVARARAVSMSASSCVSRATAHHAAPGQASILRASLPWPVARTAWISARVCSSGRPPPQRDWGRTPKALRG